MKILSFLSVIFMMFLGPAKCSKDQKIQKNAPMAIGEVYVESLESSVKDVDSGFNLFIPIIDDDQSSPTLDSVYFKNQIVKLIKKTIDSNIIYVGEFRTPPHSNGDIIMSSDPLEEMKNVPPAVPKKLPFKLEATEAIVSYELNGEMRYFKIQNIKEKTSSKMPR